MRERERSIYTISLYDIYLSKRESLEATFYFYIYKSEIELGNIGTDLQMM